MKIMITFFATMITMFAMDYVWLNYVGKSLYVTELGSLLRMDSQAISPIYWAAILVYFFLVIGVMLFVLPEASKGLMQVFLKGVCFGLIVYGVYDFTNYALLENWSLKITLIDFVWGGVLCGITGVVVAYILKVLGVNA